MSLKKVAETLATDVGFTLRKLNETQNAATAKKIKTHDLLLGWKFIRQNVIDRNEVYTHHPSAHLTGGGGQGQRREGPNHHLSFEI